MVGVCLKHVERFILYTMGKYNVFFHKWDLRFWVIKRSCDYCIPNELKLSTK